MRPFFVLVPVILSILAGCAQEQPTATLAVTGARIWTGDEAEPWAQAMAIDGERILAVGSDADISRYVTASTELIDGGALVVPGFIDTHVHFLDGGEALESVQLRARRMDPRRRLGSRGLGRRVADA